MSTLQNKIDRWFIDIDPNSSAFPPTRRYSGSSHSDQTTGTVHDVLEGAGYMGEWYNYAIDVANDSGSREMYHAGWSISDVPTLGHGHPQSNALQTLKFAEDQGGDVYVAISGHATGWKHNAAAVNELDFSTAALDARHPTAGSLHQKFTLFRTDNEHVGLLGSIDVNHGRWDKPSHRQSDPDRPRYGNGSMRGPTHDLGVKLTGTVLKDLQRTYVDRWNDVSRSEISAWAQDLRFLGGIPAPLPGADYLLASADFFACPPEISTTPFPDGIVPTDTGHTIQVLHTYAQIPGAVVQTALGDMEYKAYSWSDIGEFTIWASYLNAIKEAEEYVYIEDQYFAPFGPETLWAEHPNQTLRNASIFYQLGEALNRGDGVDVIVIISKGAHSALRYQRDRGIKYLRDRAKNAPGDFKVAYLANGQQDFKVHSKLLLVDDEFLVIGSANVNQRSMTCDGEVALAIVDETDDLASSTARDLWSEHSDQSLSGDTQSVLSAVKTAVDNGTGNFRAYDENLPREPPSLFQTEMRMIVDPYFGPPISEIAGDTSGVP